MNNYKFYFCRDNTNNFPTIASNFGARAGLKFVPYLHQSLGSIRIMDGIGSDLVVARPRKLKLVFSTFYQYPKLE
jgi:hypothetical protein